MKNQTLYHFMSVLALLGMASSVSFATLEIVQPTSGQTLNGTVRVEATKSDARHGWVAYKIEGPEQSGDYATAITHPFAYVWDTNKRMTDGNSMYPDGEYTITAVAHMPSGKEDGMDSVRVTLRNELEPGEKPTSVRLITDYKRGREMDVEVLGTCRARVAEADETNQKITELYNGTLKADWRERAMSNSAGGTAIVRKYFNQGYTTFTGVKPTSLPNVGDIFTTVVSPDGAVKSKHDDDPDFKLGQLYLELPDKTLREGTTWKSTMYVLPMLRAEPRKVRGSHRLDGFQLVGGHKCARIISTYSEKNVKLRIRMGTSVAPATGMGRGDMDGMPAGPEPGMLPPGAGPMPPPDPAMDDPGMDMPGAAAGTKTMAVQAPPVTEIKTSYNGTRISYFALDLGQFVRAEDIITHKLTIEKAQFGNISQPGMMGGEYGYDPETGGLPPGDYPMGSEGPGAMPPPPEDPDQDMAPPEDQGRRRRPGQPTPRQLKKEVKKDFKAEAEVNLTISKRG
jgi:hypothetical protein